jgi:hypothetical protein
MQLNRIASYKPGPQVATKLQPHLAVQPGAPSNR